MYNSYLEPTDQAEYPGMTSAVTELSWEAALEALNREPSPKLSNTKILLEVATTYQIQTMLHNLLAAATTTLRKCNTTQRSETNQRRTKQVD